MTTPAKTINTSTAAPYQQTQNGSIVDAGVGSFKRMTQFRPESIDNALRPDLTRRPSAWSSSGGYGTGSRSDLGLEFTRTQFFPPYPPNITRMVTKGLVASPPSQMGAFNAPIDLDIMRSYAIRDALGHFAEAEQRLGVSLRETRQTVDLVTKYYRNVSDEAGKLVEELSDPRKQKGAKDLSRQMKDWTRGWKNIPGRYLEYLYGIKPLADEIDNAVEVLTQTRDRGCSFRLTLKGQYREGRQEVDYIPPTVGNNGVFTALVRAEVRYRAKASLVFQLPDWYWSTLPPVTPFSEQWDTTSLSFVLDWVLPVKNWIRGFEGLQLRPFFSEGSTTTFLRRSATSCHFSGQNSYEGAETLPYSLKEFSMTRTVLNSFPTEAVMALPRLRNVLGISKMNSLAALAGQRLQTLGRTLQRYY